MISFPHCNLPVIKYDVFKLETKKLYNTPGIYAWRCKINNKYLVGETINLKNRIPNHLTYLKNGEANKKFLKDFTKYGPENFELIIYEEGSSCGDFMYRKQIEKQLSTELSLLGLCYNSITCETHTERPKGEFPSSPGVYCIRCVVNNARYYGETEQRRGLAGRISKWKSKLRANKEKNLSMQKDWNLFGEENFEFLVIEEGPEWLDKEKRLKREEELCSLHVQEGGVLYNVFMKQKRPPSIPLKSKEVTLRNQTKEFRSYISTINKGRENVNRKAVFAESNIYLSIQEAAESLNISPVLVRKKIQKQLYRYATTEEIQQEKERRTTLNVGPIRLETMKKQKGQAKRCRIHGVDFNSLSEAALSLGISVQAISKNLSEKREGYFFIDEHGNPME
jgi:group I intron endonuclease